MFQIPIGKSALCTLLVSETADVNIFVAGMSDHNVATNICWAFNPLRDDAYEKKSKPTPASIGEASPPGDAIIPMMASPLQIFPKRISINGFSGIRRGVGPAYSGEIKIVIYLWTDLSTSGISMSLDNPVVAKFCFGGDIENLRSINSNGTSFPWGV